MLCCVVLPSLLLPLLLLDSDNRDDPVHIPNKSILYVQKTAAKQNTADASPQIHTPCHHTHGNTLPDCPFWVSPPFRCRSCSVALRLTAGERLLNSDTAALGGSRHQPILLVRSVRLANQGIMQILHTEKAGFEVSLRPTMPTGPDPRNEGKR